MTQNDILILAKAGFTANQIAALNATQGASPVQPAQEVPAVPSVPEVPVSAAPLTYEQFQQELQRMALMGAQQSGKLETADDILASIINPPTNREVK